MGTEMNTLHILNKHFSIEIKTKMQQTKHSVTGVFFCSNLDPDLKHFWLWMDLLSNGFNLHETS